MTGTETALSVDHRVGRVRSGQIAAFALVLALLALLAWGLVAKESGPRSQGPAPNFTLTTFDGQEITLSDLRGQVVVINFWASWWPPLP